MPNGKQHQTGFRGGITVESGTGLDRPIFSRPVARTPATFDDL
jgi:hypothetical protein